MSDILWVMGYAGIFVGCAAVLFLLDALLLGLANRFADRSAEYHHRVGTQIPRVLP